jgi:hypothetical protein
MAQRQRLADHAADGQSHEGRPPDAKRAHEPGHIVSQKVEIIRRVGRIRIAVPAHVVGEHAMIAGELEDLVAPHLVAGRQRVAEDQDRCFLVSLKAIGDPDVVHLDAGHRTYQ